MKGIMLRPHNEGKTFAVFETTLFDFLRERQFDTFKTLIQGDFCLISSVKENAIQEVFVFVKTDFREDSNK